MSLLRRASSFVMNLIFPVPSAALTTCEGIVLERFSKLQVYM
jgi:hypothetical protein